jgi:hypothetical protein
MLEAKRSQDADPGNTQLGLFATPDTLPSPGPADSSGDSPLREYGCPTGPGSPGSTTPRRESGVPEGAADADSDSSEDLGGSGRRNASPLLAPSTEGGSPRLENTGDNTRPAASDAVHPEKSANPCILSTPLKPELQDASLSSPPPCLTFQALCKAVEVLRAIRGRTSPNGGEGHAQPGAPDPSPHGTDTESGEDPRRR